jgi:hypothetical protein
MLIGTDGQATSRAENLLTTLDAEGVLPATAAMGRPYTSRLWALRTSRRRSARAASILLGLGDWD